LKYISYHVTMKQKTKKAIVGAHILSPAK